MASRPVPAGSGILAYTSETDISDDVSHSSSQTIDNPATDGAGPVDPPPDGNACHSVWGCEAEKCQLQWSQFKEQVSLEGTQVGRPVCKAPPQKPWCGG